jgi:hypothetical protein
MGGPAWGALVMLVDLGHGNLEEMLVAFCVRALGLKVRWPTLPSLLLDGVVVLVLLWWWGRVDCVGHSQCMCALVVLWWHFRMCQFISPVQTLLRRLGVSHCCLSVSVQHTWC